jgi:hypothetical protein
MKTTKPDDLMTIDENDLATVSGGRRTASAKDSSADAAILAMLDDIGDALKDLGSSKSSSGGLGDLLPLLLLTGMMGPGGGGAGAPPPPPPAPVAPAPTTCNIVVSSKRGGC